MATLVRLWSRSAARLNFVHKPAVRPLSNASMVGRGAQLLEKLGKSTPSTAVADDNCGTVEEEVVEMEDMFMDTPVGKEWGGKSEGRNVLFS